MNPQTAAPKRNREAGFTLTEALVATLILMFGLASIFNLMIVATTSNNVANRASAATLLAAEQLEKLRSTPYSLLVNSATDTLATQTKDFFVITEVEGVGQFETRWLIQDLTNANIKFLQVRTEPGGFRGRQARAEFTTIRSCTLGTAAGCPL
ncbi:MAG: prepilin-type N-terminal cleavage/methylation domain-containing protein [Vicinamibacteria bacterium]